MRKQVNFINMLTQNEQRLIVKIAHLYYYEGLKQSEISAALHISQSCVSRMLSRATKEGIIKINIIQPANIFIDLELEIQNKYKIDQVIIVDVVDENNEEQIKQTIGAAAAHYLQTTIREDDFLGISSWSSHIRAMVDKLHPLNIKAKGVIQLLGGVGTNGNVNATILTHTLANYLNCDAFLLPSQSIEMSKEYFDHVMGTDEVKQVVSKFKEVSMAIIGIGELTPSSLLKNSGNYYNESMLKNLESKGAVGDICLHYFDKKGKPILSPDEDTAIGMQLNEIISCPHVVALAGGRRRAQAIKGALMGGYVDVLITDKVVAEMLV